MGAIFMKFGLAPTTDKILFLFNVLNISGKSKRKFKGYKGWKFRTENDGIIKEENSGFLLFKPARNFCRMKSLLFPGFGAFRTRNACVQFKPDQNDNGVKIYVQQKNKQSTNRAIQGIVF